MKDDTYDTSAIQFGFCYGEANATVPITDYSNIDGLNLLQVPTSSDGHLTFVAYVSFVNGLKTYRKIFTSFDLSKYDYPIRIDKLVEQILLEKAPEQNYTRCFLERHRYKSQETIDNKIEKAIFAKAINNEEGPKLKPQSKGRVKCKRRSPKQKK